MTYLVQREHMIALSSNNNNMDFCLEAEKKMDPSTFPETGYGKCGLKERPLSCGSDSGYSGSLGSNPDRLSSPDPNNHVIPGNTGSISQVSHIDNFVGQGKASSGRRGTPIVIVNEVETASKTCQTSIVQGISPPPDTLYSEEGVGITQEIILPQRFQMRLFNAQSNSFNDDPSLDNGFDQKEGTNLSACNQNCCDIDHPKDTNKTLCNCETNKNRDTDQFYTIGKDIEIALQWLRLEMVRMKAQDRKLMSTFLELRSKIHKLRNDSLDPQSTTDLTSVSTINLRNTNSSLQVPGSPLGRTTSTSSSGRGALQALRDECQVEFRARTVSMVPPRPKKVVEKKLSKELL